MGSRYVPQASLGDWNLARRMLSRLGIWVTRVALPKARAVSDPASGYFLVRRSAIANVPLQAQGFKLLVELLDKGRIERVAEVPFEFGVRRAGKSKGNLRIVGAQLSLLWTLRRRS
jgi:dolichol-phosphate mannosyltransferase